MHIFVQLISSGRRAVVPLLVLAVTAACYTTRPLQTREPAVGQRVVLVLTDAGSVDLAKTIGPSMTAVEGTVTSVNSNGVAMKVTRVEQRSGPDVTWNGEPITVPTSAIATMRERNLDRRKSWAMAGAIAGVVALLGILIGVGVIGGGNNDSGGPPQ
ncbi:MAG TPA: hypothetical protein VJ672_00115 [Gemmatimonadaceae bacterium]|nr:hypothetical protein [Gemmatimonadaceae bacterium]